MGKKQFIVFGIGRFGASLAKTLCEMGHEVLAIDTEEDAVRDIAPYVTQAMQMDATDDDAPSRLGLHNFDAAVVAIGTNVRDSIMVSLLCKEAGIPRVIAKAIDDKHAKVLYKMGVDRVVFPEREMGTRVAHTLAMPNILDVIALNGKNAMESVKVPRSWIGRTLPELDVRRKTGVSVISVERGGSMLVDLHPDFTFLEGDVLTLVGAVDEIQKIAEKD